MKLLLEMLHCRYNKVYVKGRGGGILDYGMSSLKMMKDLKTYKEEVLESINNASKR